MLCYIGVGSNLGDRLGYIRRALGQLKKHKDVEIKRYSPVYETKPWGGCQEQPDYYNLVIEAEVLAGPRDLLKLLRDIELRVGRTRSRERWASREVDLDILLCEDLILQEKDLKIPHPFMHERSFVLRPMVDLNPSLMHPRLKMDMAALLRRNAEVSELSPVQEVVGDI